MTTPFSSTAQELRQLADFVALHAVPGTVFRGTNHAYHVAEHRSARAWANKANGSSKAIEYTEPRPVIEVRDYRRRDKTDPRLGRVVAIITDGEPIYIPSGPTQSDVFFRDIPDGILDSFASDLAGPMKQAVKDALLQCRAVGTLSNEIQRSISG